MKKLRVMMLVHSYLVPPEDLKDPDDPRMKTFGTEFDVKSALQKLGHDVKIVPIDDSIVPIRQTIEQWKPDIAFNMMESFADNGALDYYIVSYLDMLKVPYTGCNPRGLILSRDKALSKKLLSFHKVRVPKFRVFAWGRKINKHKAEKLTYPMIVKSLTEQGSIGIAQASYVTTADELIERVRQVHEMTGDDAIAEQYIDGRELYVTVLGNHRLEVFPIRELVFDKAADQVQKIATYSVKWNEKYRERWGIDYIFARNLPKGVEEQIKKLAKRVYRILDMSGYARLDLRLDKQGKVYILEANANAAIARDEDVAFAAEKAGYSYEQLIQRLLNLGLRAHKYD
ncbi:MAG: ATP-grasp domain-containing protein [Thioalkalispiraceae bacterium]|jgi:D-alanine-D-alanine ligase